MDNLNSLFLSYLQNNLSWFVDQSGVLFSIILFFLLTLVIFLWLYCGFYILFDFSRREKKLFITIFLFVLGIMFGPIALVIYFIFRPRYTFEEKFLLDLEKKFFYNNASKVVQCINCNQFIPENYIYCVSCGTRNRFNCPNCSNLVGYDTNYCYYCGFLLTNESFNFHSKNSNVAKNSSFISKFIDYFKIHNVVSNNNIWNSLQLTIDKKFSKIYGFFNLFPTVVNNQEKNQSLKNNNPMLFDKDNSNKIKTTKIRNKKKKKQNK